MKIVIFLIIGILILAGLFVFLKPGDNNLSVKETSIPANTLLPSPTPETNSQVINLEIKQDKLVLPEEPIRVNEGAFVSFQITSDVQDEFHLHGYNKSVELIKDQKVLLTFTADKTGRFAFELERAKKDLGALEVYPK